MLLQEFEEYCRRSVVADHPDDSAVYGQLCEDMVRNCAEEVALRDAELAALEKEMDREAGERIASKRPQAAGEKKSAKQATSPGAAEQERLDAAKEAGKVAKEAKKASAPAGK